MMTEKSFSLTSARAFLLISLWGMACGATGDSTLFTETRLNDRVLILHHAPWSETMTVVDAGPGLIVVDTWGSLRAAEKAAVRIREIFGKPVSHVINTHHHWDHTFGNRAFQGAEIVGHWFCARDMAASYGNPSVRKTKLEESALLADHDSVRKYVLEVAEEAAADSFRIRMPDRLIQHNDILAVGDLTVLLYQTPGIHTRSNLTVFIEEQGIVFGRREFAGDGPISLERGADPIVIVRVLESILATGRPVRVLIPGHGDAVENPNLKLAAERLRGMVLK